MLAKHRESNVVERYSERGLLRPLCFPLLREPPPHAYAVPPGTRCRGTESCPNSRVLLHVSPAGLSLTGTGLANRLGAAVRWRRAARSDGTV